MRCNLHMVKFQHPRALPPRNEKLSSFKNSNLHDLEKIMNICAVKNVTTRGSLKNAPPPPIWKKRSPHIEKISSFRQYNSLATPHGTLNDHFNHCFQSKIEK